MIINLEKPPLDELIHFGVLGMHWGHRKPQIGSRTDGFKIKKGATIYRTTTTKIEPNEGHAFVSIDKKDAIGYMSRGSMFNQIAFNTTFKATKDLVAPSKKIRVDEFIKLLDSDKEFRDNLSKSAAQYKIFSKPEDIKQQINNLKTIKEKTKLYNRELALGVASNKIVRDKYLKSLSDLGYNMMIDDADAGIVSRMPVIIFDRKESLEVISVNKVTRGSIKKMKKSVK